MRLRALIVRNLKELVRDRMTMAFIISFPIVFMVVLGLVFGGSGAQPLPLGVVDEDRSLLSEAFIQAMKESRAFELKFYPDRLKAEEEFRVGEVLGILVLPQDFGEKASARFQGGLGKVPLYLSYDTTDIQRRITLESRLIALGQAFFGIEQPISFEVNPIETRIKKPAVNFFAVAYSIFGMMTLIANVATLWVSDRRRGWLSRLWSTPLTSKDFLLGYSVPFLLFALVFPFLYLGVSFALGARVVGNFLWVLMPVWLTGILSIGVGMVVASLTKNEQQAAGLSWLVIVPMAMLSGVFFPKEGMPSYMQRIANVLPFGHAVEASRLVMSRGADLAAIKGELLIVLLWIILVYLANLPLLRRLMQV